MSAPHARQHVGNDEAAACRGVIRRGAARVPPLIATLSRPSARERTERSMQRSGRPTMAKRSMKSSVSVPASAGIACGCGHAFVALRSASSTARSPAETGPLALPCITEKRAKVESAAHQAARRFNVGVAAEVDVGAKAMPRRDRGRRLCGSAAPARCPAPVALDIGAEREHHPLGVAPPWR